MTSQALERRAGRRLLDGAKTAPEALERMASFHSEVVHEVERAVNESSVVVVGMAQDPVVKKVRKALADAGIEFNYLEYGSYLSQWKPRLAIKLWSGWPTFPQVFVRGMLLGGLDLTASAIAFATGPERTNDGDASS